MYYEQEIDNFTKRLVYMNHFIFFQVSVSYQSGYDESIPNTHFFSHSEFKLRLYSVDHNLVLMCVMSVVNDKLIHLDHAWYNQINQLSHFDEFVSARLALCSVCFLCEPMNY